MAKGGRSAARRMLLQALYQAQISGHSVPELAEQFAEHSDYPGADSDYFLKLLQQIDESKVELDEHIVQFGDIPVAQLDPVEHAVLWIALAELSWHADIPAKVAINEGIELAKSFGAEGGHKYVNGLLDKAAASLRSS